MNNMNSILVIMHSSTKYGDENLYFSEMEFRRTDTTMKKEKEQKDKQRSTKHYVKN